MTDAIAAYQRALRTFDGKRAPVEFAILQNNLATAFLSLPSSDETAKMHEALGSAMLRRVAENRHSGRPPRRICDVVEQLRQRFATRLDQPRH
jgi:hypothetical protein